MFIGMSFLYISTNILSITSRAANYANYVSSSFLCIGDILAIFNISGKIPLFTIWFIIIVKGFIVYNILRSQVVVCPIANGRIFNPPFLVHVSIIDSPFHATFVSISHSKILV